MPHLTSVRHHPKHRNHQPRPTPSHRLQHPYIPSNKLRPIQSHLPSLPPRHARLLTNIRHYTRKLTHFAATGLTAATSASISRLLPTQNGVR
jgi:hypothetical protein